MKKTDRKRFAEILGSTAELFNRTITPAAIELWWNVLSDLELSAIEQGISRHLRDPDRGKFMPTPADVRHFCGSRHASAAIAWGEVLDTMESHGAYASVLFADGVINAVVRDLGGWPAVCHRQATDDEPVWLQKDFERRYAEYQASGRASHQSLAGLHQLENFKIGISAGAPCYIESGQEIERHLLVSNPETLIGDNEPPPTGTDRPVRIGTLIQMPKKPA